MTCGDYYIFIIMTIKIIFICLFVCLFIHSFIHSSVFGIGTPSDDPLHPDYCPHLSMGYGCKDDNLKTMKRYQRQLK